MSDHSIQLYTLIVQALALFGLVWYAIETLRLRKAAQEQVEASNNQVEGLSKPCLTFVGDYREGADTILAMHDATGNIIAARYNGNYLITNMGSGVALNIRYQFTRPNLPTEPRYIPHLAATGRASLVEPYAAYNAEHQVTFDYESVGGRKYRTTINLNHHVITSFHFEQLNS